MPEILPCTPERIAELQASEADLIAGPLRREINEQLELRARIAERRCALIAEYCDQVAALTAAKPPSVPPSPWVIRVRQLLGVSS